MQAVLTFLTKDAKTGEVTEITQTMFASDIFEVYATCREAIKPFRWTRPQDWTLELEGGLTPLTVWMLKFDEEKISSGFDLEDCGIETKTYYVIKPFEPFTLDEVNFLERERIEGDYIIQALKSSSMETGGVLVDFGYPFKHQTFDLTELL